MNASVRCPRPDKCIEFDTSIPEKPPEIHHAKQARRLDKRHVNTQNSPESAPGAASVVPCRAAEIVIPNGINKPFFL